MTSVKSIAYYPYRKSYTITWLSGEQSREMHGELQLTQDLTSGAVTLSAQFSSRVNSGSDGSVAFDTERLKIYLDGNSIISESETYIASGYAPVLSGHYGVISAGNTAYTQRTITVRFDADIKHLGLAKASVDETYILTIPAWTPDVPVISCSMSGDRYGVNIAANINIAAPYECESTFTLNGLTAEQASSRATATSYTSNSASWFAQMSSTPFQGMIDCDSTRDMQPLDSGGSYPWSLSVTCANGRITTISGTLVLPQKVTSLYIPQTVITLPLGSAKVIGAAAMPENAELRSLTYSSGDAQTVSVSAAGALTPVALGTATVSITTDDGNYGGAVTVIVVDGAYYPTISATRYLSAELLNNIYQCCNFLNVNASLGLNIATYTAEQACPVINVRATISTVLAVCADVIEAAVIQSKTPNEITADDADFLRQAIPKSNKSMLVFEQITRAINALNAIYNNMEG